MARARSRKLGYRWHLRRLMAEHDMFATTDLVPLLAERGVALSAAQVYRLVTGTPERLSLRDPGRAVRHPRLHPDGLDRTGRRHRRRDDTAAGHRHRRGQRPA